VGAFEILRKDVLTEKGWVGGVWGLLLSRKRNHWKLNKKEERVQEIIKPCIGRGTKLLRGSFLKKGGEMRLQKISKGKREEGIWVKIKGFLLERLYRLRKKRGDSRRGC